MRNVLMIGLLLSGIGLAKESKIDLNKNVATSREVVQLLERSKKLLQSEKGQNNHRQLAIQHIMSAMAEVRAQTSKPGH